MPSSLRTSSLLVRRRLQSVRNRIASLTPWEVVRNSAFVFVGLWMLLGLHYGFWRLLDYLNSVQLIGPLLIW